MSMGISRIFNNFFGGNKEPAGTPLQNTNKQAEVSPDQTKQSTNRVSIPQPQHKKVVSEEWQNQFIEHIKKKDSSGNNVISPNNPRNGGNAWAIHGSQIMLHTLGYFKEAPSKIPTEQYFASIRQFQKDYKITNTGKIGETTAICLCEAYNRTFEVGFTSKAEEINRLFLPPHPSTKVFLDFAIKNGVVLRQDSHLKTNPDFINIVKSLQIHLNEINPSNRIQVTGNYGHDTAIAVAETQRILGITNAKGQFDGIAGPQTIKAILESCNKLDRVSKVVKKNEGGTNALSADKGNTDGGITKFGITQDAYDDWRDKLKLPKDNTLFMTENESRLFVRDEYYNKLKIDQFKSEEFSAILLDWAFQHTSERTTTHLNRYLRRNFNSEIKSTNQIGTDTVNTINSLNPEGLVKVLKEIARWRGVAYEQTDTAEFDKGFEERQKTNQSIVKNIEASLPEKTNIKSNKKR